MRSFLYLLCSFLYKIEHRKAVLFMAQQTFSIRMDEKLKKEFDLLVEDMGMNATTAFNIFARAVVREKKIPFEINTTESKKEQTLTKKQLLELLNTMNED